VTSKAVTDQSQAAVYLKVFVSQLPGFQPFLMSCSKQTYNIIFVPKCLLLNLEEIILIGIYISDTCTMRCEIYKVLHISAVWPYAIYRLATPEGISQLPSHCGCLQLQKSMDKQT